ncbi:MAG: asparagine synthase [Clostridiales bacterium]|jgi:hypothetical protein|nr:asparagine synthase [Clostridiales bacterium]
MFFYPLSTLWKAFHKIDSAIIAKYMPRGSIAYTFRCVADGARDETEAAKKYAAECGLIHKTIDVHWEDYLEFSPVLMKRKGAPIHSIEPQIYKASLIANADGVKNLIFGENADMIFGGLDGLISKDWLFDEFAARYAYIDPARVLKKPVKIAEPFEEFRAGYKIDFYSFICKYFYLEANGSYSNACGAAGVNYVSPFSQMALDAPLDYSRIRSGEPKYMLYEIFRSLYPGWPEPAKLPMPRAVGRWLRDWKGPIRPEFIENAVAGLSADQKWMVYILERFLNMIEREDHE